MIFLGTKETPGASWEGQKSHEEGTTHQGAPGCAHLEAHLCVKPMLKNPINREIIRNNPISEVPPPQGSVAIENQSRTRSGTLLEGGIITSGHLHHPGGHHDEEGVVYPRG